MTSTRTGNRGPAYDPTEVAGQAAPEDGLVDDDVTRSTLAPAPPPRRTFEALAAGELVGEYRIEGRIGEGGMGVVFAAVHPVIGKRAAIKVLRHELAQDPMAVARFIAEARVVNQIGHPNIVDIFAFGQLPDGNHYFVMEWLNGATLRDHIGRGPLGVAASCAIVRALARALEAAHDKGVVHRDLKPDNVVLVEIPGEPMQVKLLDFGIAKLAETEIRVERTASGAMIGTPQYIAPEQAKGHAVDHRADIYALGGVLFEMLTGRPPFLADNAMEMIAKHLMEPPPHPAAFAADVPADLDAIVVAMLAKEPRGRPSLADLVRVLEVDRRVAPQVIVPRAFASTVTATPHAAASATVVAPAAANRGVRVGLAVVGALILAGASFALVSKLGRRGGESSPREASAPVVPTPTPVATPTPIPAPTPTPAPTRPPVSTPMPPPPVVPELTNLTASPGSGAISLPKVPEPELTNVTATPGKVAPVRVKQVHRTPSTAPPIDVPDDFTMKPGDLTKPAGAKRAKGAP